MDKRLDDLYDQIEIVGFPLSNPFELADADGETFTPSAALHQYKGKTVTALTYFIARKHVVTKHSQEMFFGTFVDAALDWIDTVHFPDSAKRFPLHKAGFYRITGQVVEEFQVFSIVVQKMEKVGHKRRVYENLH